MRGFVSESLTLTAYLYSIVAFKFLYFYFLNVLEKLTWNLILRLLKCGKVVLRRFTYSMNKLNDGASIRCLYIFHEGF